MPLAASASQVAAAVFFPNAVQQQGDLVAVRDDALISQERNQIRESLRFVALRRAPDANHRWVVGVGSLWVGNDGLVVAERAAVFVAPIGGCHPTVVAFHDVSMGAVVGGEFHHGAVREALRELQDVPHRRAAEAVEALVLVAHHAQVAGGAGQLHQQLLLDVVGVLVLVHQQEADGRGNGGG